MSRTLLGGLAAAVLLAAGCGGPTVYPVRGRVAFPDGTPLESGRVVVFTGAAAVGSSGLIHPDGSFEMGTHTSTDGVPPGEWTVYIENAITHPPSGYEGKTPFVSKPLIAPKFADPEKSGLKFTVPDQLEWKITVEKPPGK